MKSLLCSILLLVAVAAQADLKREITARDKAITSAMAKKDYKTLEKLMRAGMAPTFVYMEGGQKQNLDQMISNMKMGLGSMKKLTKLSTRVLSVKEHGDKATVATEHVMEGLTAGTGQKDHTLAFKGVSEDSYVKTGGKWKMTKMVWTSQKMSMDGKPMPG